jgi:hypothetical protein
VRHAGPDTLARIAPLLAQLRGRPALRERRPGVFELQARAFLHFHDDPAGVFADVRLAHDFVRMPVTSRSEQSDLLDRIDDCLSAVESRDTDRRRREPRRRARGGSVDSRRSVAASGPPPEECE